MIEIPIRDIADVPRFDLSVVLDESTYVLGLDWSDRTGLWSLSLSLPDGTLLLAGLAIMHGRGLIRQHPVTDLPPGELACWDTTGAGLDPTRDTLGSDVVLIYVPEDEIP